MEKDIIIASNLQIAYQKQEAILNNISFQIKHKELVFITGVSGSGKSSLIKLFYGSLFPTHGSLYINGYNMADISRQNISKLRRNIGIVFQDYKLISDWSIEKNIALPMLIAGYNKKTTNTQVNRLLAHVQLVHSKNKLPKELSGGEQQRAGVARALSNNPDIILADEPTGNLDEYSTELVMELFLKVHQLGKTVIIVTHTEPRMLAKHYRHFHLENKTLHECT